MELTQHDVETFLSMSMGLWTDGVGAPDWVMERIGWVDLPLRAAEALPNLQRCADRFSKEMNHVVVMGMGGSSLCPLMWSGFTESSAPHLIVLDTTDPAKIRRVCEELALSKTAFLASSKSGTTAETCSLLDFFLSKTGGKGDRKRFAALTDPGNSLGALAKEEGFASMPSTPRNVGGRFSAFTPFGMIPACMAGIDGNGLVAAAQRMRERCLDTTRLSVNPGLSLGAWLAEQEDAGCDKLTMILSPGLESLGLWLEQLLAESLGKEGRGILPVLDDVTDFSCPAGQDRCYAGIFWSKDLTASQRWSVVPANAPRIGPFFVSTPEDLGSEIYRWEFATAVAGSLMGINPFDQPNVEAAKGFTRKILNELVCGRGLSLPKKMGGTRHVTLRGDGKSEESGEGSMILRDFLSQARGGSFISILAYLPEFETVDKTLFQIKKALRTWLPHAVTLGYGPRYLHSTGQLHKGGRNEGLFLVLSRKLAPKAQRLGIPGQAPLSFDELQLAQAAGDFQALQSHGRQVLWLEMDNLNPKSLTDLEALMVSAVRSL